MLKYYKVIILLLASFWLYGCDPVLVTKLIHNEQESPYEKFNRNRKECKAQAEKFCGFPLKNYCTLDVYEKRTIFIRNCMNERGWSDPYNMFSYYK